MLCDWLFLVIIIPACTENSGIILLGCASRNSLLPNSLPCGVLLIHVSLQNIAIPHPKVVASLWSAWIFDYLLLVSDWGEGFIRQHCKTSKYLNKFCVTVYAEPTLSCFQFGIHISRQVHEEQKERGGRGNEVKGVGATGRNRQEKERQGRWKGQKKSRRSGGDTIQYLREKSEQEMKLREKDQELEKRKQEEEKRKNYAFLNAMLQQQQQQQQQQHNKNNKNVWEK